METLSSSIPEHGFRAERNVGQSVFRCDLALYRPGDRTYRLGVLVDTAEHYGQSDLLERDLRKPRLLEELGWQVESVLTKDWFHERDRVLKRILGRL